MIILKRTSKILTVIYNYIILVILILLCVCLLPMFIILFLIDRNDDKYIKHKICRWYFDENGNEVHEQGYEIVPRKPWERKDLDITLKDAYDPQKYELKIKEKRRLYDLYNTTIVRKFFSQLKL